MTPAAGETCDAMIAISAAIQDCIFLSLITILSTAQPPAQPHACMLLSGAGEGGNKILPSPVL